MSTEIKTIFCDIDGCLIEHLGGISGLMGKSIMLLPGVEEKFAEWERAGYKIILTTGRRESLRETTENTLLALGIFYDMLIMGLPRGPRVVINDMKPGTINPTALAWSPVRNVGLKECPY